jgi:hypothetical protein
MDPIDTGRQLLVFVLREPPDRLSPDCAHGCHVVTSWWSALCRQRSGARGAVTSAVRPIIGMHDDLFRRACRLAGGIRDLWPMPLSARPIRLGDQEGPDPRSRGV